MSESYDERGELKSDFFYFYFDASQDVYWMSSNGWKYPWLIAMIWKRFHEHVQWSDIVMFHIFYTTSWSNPCIQGSAYCYKFNVTIFLKEMHWSSKRGEWYNQLWGQFSRHFNRFHVEVNRLTHYTYMKNRFWKLMVALHATDFTSHSINCTINTIYFLTFLIIYLELNLCNDDMET